MEGLKKLHYLILAGIILIAIIGATITGKQTPTGMTSMGIQHENPYYLGQEQYQLRQPVMAIQEPGAPLLPTHPERKSSHSYKVEPIDHFRAFFGTTLIFFPENNPCSTVIQKYLQKLQTLESTRIDFFSGGSGENKFLTMLYEDVEAQLGTLTLQRGFDDPNKCKLHYDIKKAIIGVSDWHEYMGMHIDVEGKHAGDKIYCERGKVEIKNYGEVGETDTHFKCEWGY